MCESLQGFQISHSLGGGTGSGFGSLLLDKLGQEYADKIIYNYSIFPGTSSENSVSDVVVEPYNSVFALSTVINSSHADFVIENPSLYRICHNLLKVP